MSDSNDCYGPALPPHLVNKNKTPDLVRKKSEDDSSYGPALPPTLSKPTKPENDANYGLALPPSTSQSSSIRPQPLGPSLPPGFQRLEHDENDDDHSSSDEDDFVGPLPPNKVTAASLALEERALEIKLGQLSQSKDDDAEHREEWMLVPPQVMAQAGVVAKKTQFSGTKCERDRDQSGWTETPDDKRRKAAGLVNKVDQKRKLQDEAERISVKKRDKEQEEIVKRHKKKHKRDKSLMDIHNEKRKKEKETAPVDQTRRPFNRETDLQLSKLNPRQIKSVVDQAKILDSRFSAGSNKFL